MEKETQEQWKDMEPGIWTPDKEGDSITGVLLTKTPKDETKDLSARYELDTAEGIKLVWGSTVLDSRMALVKVGDKIRITYKGKQQNKKGQDVKIWKLEVSQETIDKETAELEEPTETMTTDEKGRVI